MSNVPKMFGSTVFNETVMKDPFANGYLQDFQNSTALLKGEALDLPIANIIANAMKTERWNMARPILPMVPADDHVCCRKSMKALSLRRRTTRYYGFLRGKTIQGRA